MKKIKKIVLSTLLYLLGASLLGGGAWWGYKLYKKASTVENEIEKVNVSRGDIELKFQDIGEISPKTMVEVYARVGGRLSSVLVNEGDEVAKGQVVAVVQPGQSEADKFRPVEVPSPIGGTVMSCPGSRYERDAAVAKAEQRISGVSDPGSPTCLMQVADLGAMQVKLNVSEMEVFKLKRGMPVKVIVDALPALALTGKVAMISPKAERDSRTGATSFRVEIEIAQQGTGVRPGMTARIEAVMEKRAGILKMPISGLFEEGGRKFAYLDVPNAKARKADVRTGLRNETDIEILGGLKEGDTVYTDKPLNVEEEMAAAPPGAPAAKAAK